uniref:Uncharacterized protein n=1 Tax=Oryza glaberrima TaxID=4538 RepID=I1P9E2_ORYGL
MGDGEGLAVGASPVPLTFSGQPARWAATRWGGGGGGGGGSRMGREEEGGGVIWKPGGGGGGGGGGVRVKGMHES